MRFVSRHFPIKIKFIFQPLGMFPHFSVTFELDLQYSPPGRRHKRQWAREGWKPHKSRLVHGRRRSVGKNPAGFSWKTMKFDENPIDLGKL